MNLCGGGPAAVDPPSHTRLGNAGSDRVLLDGHCSVADHIEHELGLRKHRDVTRFDLVGGGVHALRRGPLEVGLNLR